MISLIVAMAKNHVIGIKNDLPWHIPADLKRFKELTRGKPCIMGRNTFESIISRIGKPLPERLNIVVSTKLIPPTHKDVMVSYDLRAAIDLAENHSFGEEVMVIGGASIYERVLQLDLIDRIYLTIVDIEPKGDAYFPQLNCPDWKVISEENLTDPVSYKNLILDRVRA